MTLPTAAAIRPSHAARSIVPSGERQVLRRIALSWYLLVVNAATWYAGLSGLHLPNPVGKAITQGALPLALVAALSANRKLIVRPNVFLCLISLLVLDTILTIMQPQHIGTVYRTVRFRGVRRGAVVAHPMVGAA